MPDERKSESLIAGRKSIQKAIDIAEEERRRQLLRRRIDLASSGVRAFQRHKIGDSVKFFQKYIHILEDWKGVPEGGLQPSLFDVKKDLPELLLISGVYWDLVKLYDRTKSPDKQKQFRHYLEKFILFSRGMPFQTLGAETLRKYISHEKPVHVNEFKNAYKMLSKSNCFIATELIDVIAPETLPRLRTFRDSILKKMRIGRQLVYLYYRNGPAAAKRINGLPRGIRVFLGKGLDLAGSCSHLVSGFSVENRANSVRPENELIVRKAKPDPN